MFGLRLWLTIAVVVSTSGLLLAAKPQPTAKAKVAIVRTADQPMHSVMGGKAGARILLDRENSGATRVALTELVLLPGCDVKSHTHGAEDEILYIQSGTGVLAFGSEKKEVKKGDVLFIPAGIKHSFKVTSAIEPIVALQVYAPGGAQQKFKKGPIVK